MLHLYSLPPEDGLIRLCMDERPCQLLDEVVTPIAAKPESVQKIDCEYKREGTCVVFLAYGIDRGLCYTQVRTQRTKKDYAEFIDWVITTYYPQAKAIKLVQDNLNTDKQGSFYEHLPAARARALSEQIDFVFTPKHGSWLNMAETEFSALSRQCLDRRICSEDALRAEIGPWTEQRNRDKVRINWTSTIAEARQKLTSRYKDVNTNN